MQCNCFLSGSFLFNFQAQPKNIFDNLPSLAPIHGGSCLVDELNLYLSTNPENIQDAIKWWYVDGMDASASVSLSSDSVSMLQPGLLSLQ
jgi:hypothetical protein